MLFSSLPLCLNHSGAKRLLLLSIPSTMFLPLTLTTSAHMKGYMAHPPTTVIFKSLALCVMSYSNSWPHEDTKLEPHSRICCFLGYGVEHKGYMCYKPLSKHFWISRHEVFWECALFHTMSKCHVPSSTPFPSGPATYIALYLSNSSWSLP